MKKSEMVGKKAQERRNARRRKMTKFRTGRYNNLTVRLNENGREATRNAEKTERQTQRTEIVRPEEPPSNGTSQNLSPRSARDELESFDGTIYGRADAIIKRAEKLRRCLKDAEPMVREFERKSGEETTAADALESLEKLKREATSIANEGEDIAASGFLDGFTEEELVEAIREQEKRLSDLTKIVSLVLALTWERMPSTC